MRFALFPMLLAAAMLFFAAAPVEAQDQPRLIDEFRAWKAHRYTPDGNDVCFMSSTPEKWTSDPQNVQRGDIYVLVTHRPAKDVRDEVSIYTGYPYEEGSRVTVAIDGQDFELFTHGETAWAYDAEQDRRLVQAMIRGNTMVIRGTSSRGTLTVDTYSLAGFTAAHDAIGRACDVG